MPNLTFVTGNPAKFHIGASICQSYGVTLDAAEADLQEIQSENGEDVAVDKAIKAYRHFGKPVIISDDNWLIPGLNNFPGAYMKSINTWFTPSDWLRLTLPLEDRTITLRLIVVFHDENGHKMFTSDIQGTLLKEIRGRSKYSHTTIMSFNNGRTSLAEDIEAGHTSSDVPHSAWHQLGAWLKGGEQ